MSDHGSGARSLAEQRSGGPRVRLPHGTEIPQLGLGVFQIAPDQVQPVVEQALAIGYRHIDTAAAYNNEAGVGAALRASGIPRDEVFVTSKLRNGEHGTDTVRQAYDDSCARLGLDQLDLYLIHWPHPTNGRFVESWDVLETLYGEGRVGAVGVSNFLPHHLETLTADSALAPAVNQIELHPTYQQADVVACTERLGAVVEAYSPLGQGADLASPVVVEIAGRLEVTPAQVVLGWHLQAGRVVIPKSATPARLRENFDALAVDLTDADVAALTALEAGQRIGNDPDTFALSQIR